MDPYTTTNELKIFLKEILKSEMKLQKLNKEDKDYILSFILEEIKDRGEYYLENSIISLVFSYGIRDGRALEKISNIKIQSHNYQHHKLPITMNPLEYGLFVKNFGNTYIIQINDKNYVHITQHDKYNEVEFYRSGSLVYKWMDKWMDKDMFRRILGRKEFIFKNNELYLYKTEKSAKFISNLHPEEEITNKIITLDIETYLEDGVHIPYCISRYDGENNFTYDLSNFDSSVNMIKTCISEIMIKKYNNYKIYIHNMAGFDAIFLLKILADLGQVKPIIHNDKIISIQFRIGNYTVQFKDSQQMLLFSLRNLAKAFGVDTQKSYFPYDFINENNLDYIGITPDFKYFNGLSHDEYDGITSYNWNLKEESIKYCNIDCISLYQIITKFNNMIFELFKINIHKYPTLSSLAFAIFRTHFLKNDTIPQISGEISRDIRQSYTGGAVDMYIPINDENTEIFAYDVNSLYPFVMKNNLMPTGKPIKFYGDIRKVDPKAFGFFYCNIKAPDNLLHPILQTHVKVNKGIRTIAPLGQWSDMIFSAEMDNAIKYGYEFEILWGYTFKPKNIFKGYVETLYELRTKYPKSNPLNLVAKLLLNSLYGRFGMIDSFIDIRIFDNFKEFKIWYNIHNEDIIKFEELGNKIIVQYKSEDKNQKTMLYGTLETHNISIAIASAITAYARIHMSQFKNNPNFKLYYSDTDSIYIDKPLPDYMISDTILGKMKLENILTDAIFLAPKMYYLETIDGKTIYKVKGLKHEIELNKDDFESLLIKQSILEKIQTKWIKNLSLGNIHIRNELYTLQVTNNKREYLLFSFRKLTILKLRFFKI
jgi:DNA polymerase type B, organellar and viral